MHMYRYNRDSLDELKPLVFKHPSLQSDELLIEIQKKKGTCTVYVFHSGTVAQH